MNNLVQTEAPYKDVCRSVSIRESLEEKRNSLSTKLKTVNETIEALDKNPEAAKLVELLAQVARY